jgi:hypothetical protein
VATEDTGTSNKAQPGHLVSVKVANASYRPMTPVNTARTIPTIPPTTAPFTLMY